MNLFKQYINNDERITEKLAGHAHSYPVSIQEIITLEYLAISGPALLPFSPSLEWLVLVGYVRCIYSDGQHLYDEPPHDECAVLFTLTDKGEDLVHGQD